MAITRSRREDRSHPTCLPQMTQRTTLRCVASLPTILTTDILQWCSFCNDFATIIVLCAGCRVSICMRSQQVLESACLEWDEMITRPDFIFYCPYCCHSTGNTCAVGHPAIAHLQQSEFTSGNMKNTYFSLITHLFISYDYLLTLYNPSPLL